MTTVTYQQVFSADTPAEFDILEAQVDAWLAQNPAYTKSVSGLTITLTSTAQTLVLA